MFKKRFDKVPISPKKHRVVLSDVLPFEMPPTFSNSNFYKFLVKYNVSIEGSKVTWRKGDNITGYILCLLFGLDSTKINGNCIEFDDKKNSKKIPYKFRIIHKKGEYRELTVIHPFSQLKVLEFYSQYKQLMLYYSSKSPFSIRRPHKLAYYKFFKDDTHDSIVSKNEAYDGGEEYDKEYETLKTFFVYKKYSNIHKFYESYTYHRCEKKYNKLLKFDIAKCFDSIYTHSIVWALTDKGLVKDNIKSSLNTFGGKFDRLLQDLNYGETNGIVIGPEFSRVFSELMLQQIDRDVFNHLIPEGFNHQTTYEVFRYVDDYFVFYNEETDKDIILKQFRLALKQYNLAINNEKTIEYEKPLITELTIAKLKVSSLINKYLNVKTITVNKKEAGISENDGEEKASQDEISDSVNKKGYLYVSSNHLITRFKTIIKETGIEYKDILNYTLASIDVKLHRIFKELDEVNQENKKYKGFINSIIELIDFIFFIYSVSPRVNTTIKLSRILARIIDYLKSQKDISPDLKQLVFKKILDDTTLILKKNSNSLETPVETLYLTAVLDELGKSYKIEYETLLSYFGLEKISGAIMLKEKHRLQYFSIIHLLFYIKNRKGYQDIMQFLKNHILDMFNEQLKRKKAAYDDTQLILLLFDLLACPYLGNRFKNSLLNLYRITDSDIRDGIIKYCEKKKHWFTKWVGFNFSKALEAKKGQEVY